MKYTFVGDIHGKVEEVSAALSMEGKVIFVGDIIDSFDRTVDQHEECFLLIFEAIRKGKAQCIFGNHDLQYVLPNHRCSGYSIQRDSLMQKVAPEMMELFVPFIFMKEHSLLVTHAGLTNQIWVEHHLTKDGLEEVLEKWWKDPRSPAHWIGRYRGGWHRVGGIFWCDRRREFQPVEGLSQVFGHTSSACVDGILEENKNWCIDCLDRWPATYLEMDL